MPNYAKYIFAGLKPDPYVDLVDWSNTFRFLPRESSREPGRYRTSRTPWVEEILRELSPQSPTTEVVAVKPTQFGFTELANNFLFAVAHLYPGPCQFAMPTEGLVEDHSLTKIAKSIDCMPCLQGIILPPRAKDSRNKILRKEFPGGFWRFSGANSPVEGRSRSIRYLVRDDFDGWESSKEGDHGGLLNKRTDAYGDRKKIYTNSTPTGWTTADIYDPAGEEGGSKIWAEYLTSSRGLFNVPCPHCGKYQFLEWGGPDETFGIKFTRDEDGEISDCWYQCACCQNRIDEYEKTWMLENGKWIHEFPNRKKRGFRINAFFSPLGWVSWEQIAREVLDSKGDKGKAKVVCNTRFALPFKMYELIRSADQIELLKDDRPFGIVPSGVEIVGLTGAVDTQGEGKGFWFEVRAWAGGLDRESWQVRAGKVETFDAIYQIMHTDQYSTAGGKKFIVNLVVIDAMGDRTADVYDFCILNRGFILPYQGVQTMTSLWTASNQEFYPGKKKNGTRRPIPGGLQLYRCNVTYFKNMLAQKLQIAPGDPGAWHMSAEMTRAWAEQMTVEIVENGKWINPLNRPNHAGDVSHMQLIAADILQLQHKGGKPEPTAPPPRENVREEGLIF